MGDWGDEATSSLITSHCHWSPDRHYLLRKFSVKVDGHEVLSSTTRIGWDPRAQQIKSWVFDNRGGYAEGLWTQAGNRWIIKMRGVQQNGDTASATNLLTRIDNNTATWESLDRTVAGQLLPPIDKVTLVRMPPAPADTPAHDSSETKQ